MGVGSSVLDIDHYYCIEAFLYKDRGKGISIEIVCKHVDGYSVREEDPPSLMETKKNKGFPIDSETIDNVKDYLKDKIKTTYLSPLILEENKSSYIRLYSCNQMKNPKVRKMFFF